MSDPRFLQTGFDKQLAHFIEEAGEALAAAGKTQRWGADSVNPLIVLEAAERNADWLWRELLDVEQAVARLKATMLSEGLVSTAGLTAGAAIEVAITAREDRFWLIVREPGRVPVRKGPWMEGPGRKPAILREFMEANPTAYIDVLTLGYDGPDIEHGPQLLQMLDGRSMAKGRKQIEVAREAHAPHHAALAADADALVLLAAAREYVADALEAHEHSDGRELLAKIDATYGRSAA